MNEGLKHNWLPDTILPWMDTDRPFFEDGKPLSQSSERSLCISMQEVEVWVEKQYRVMEVGVTSGLAMSQLLAKGVDIYGIEPGLKFDEGVSKYPVKYQLLGLTNRVFPVFASEVIESGLVSPDSNDVVFANAVNFQDYATSPKNLFSSLLALTESLKKEPHSYMTFSVNKPDASGSHSVFMLSQGGASNRLNLQKLLQDSGARYDFHTPNPTSLSDKSAKPAIRIYRVNEAGEDLLQQLAGVQSLQPYI